MLESVLTSAGIDTSSVCTHEIDDKQMPEWNKRDGKVWTCIKCGVKVHKNNTYHPMPGERIHVSKKERRRRKG